MSRPRVEMALEYNGEEVATAMVFRTYAAIERQRYLWVHTYGLTPKKDWKIYLKVPSTMSDFMAEKALKIKTQFPFITKKENQNDNATTISEFI
jgi:hypothetical protein